MTDPAPTPAEAERADDSAISLNKTYRRWPRPLRHFLHRPRLSAAALLFLVIFFASPDSLSPEIRLLIAFDCATLAFLLAAAWMMAKASPATMRRRAILEDEGKWVVLTLSSLAALAILAALGVEQSGPKQFVVGRIALLIATIVLSWMFINTIFAIHYAHDFYGGREAARKGLTFPGTDHPDYWDFVYFAFVLGMTFQVSDVVISCQPLRRLATFHGMLAFFFNVFILALSVNLIASAF